MKFKIWNGLYCLCYKMKLMRMCWWIYPHLMENLKGTTVDGITVA